MEGFHHLYHPVVRRLLELVDTGELGAVVSVEATIASMAAPLPGDGYTAPEVVAAGLAVADARSDVYAL